MKEDIILDAPVRSLQQMLRTLSFVLQDFPAVIPDGIYGHSTEEAVREFQRRYHLPVTGSVDFETFYGIVAAYNSATEELDILYSPVVRFPAKMVITQGQYQPIVFLIQGMFAALSQHYPKIRKGVLTGINDSVTTENVKILQQLSGLPVSGNIDIRTYQQLSNLFRVILDNAAAPSQG